MRWSSFWPPRRTRDRLAAEYFRRRNPDAPWIPRATVELLPGLLRSTDQCLEWGSGSSTAWLSRRVGHVVSVEHDPVWFQRVRAELASPDGDNGSLRLLSIDPDDQPGASPYVRVVDEFDDGELDMCFVDGEHRAACILAVIPKLSSGGVLMLDDAQCYLDHPTSSPHSRYGKGPLDDEWKQFAEIAGTWRLIWTGDGYSDAAIWIKP
jgi:predicted O-methyltransferase YrrM